ncbi:MAG: cytochrome P460 family protein [Alphaproteobacteria bacterium]
MKSISRTALALGIFLLGGSSFAQDAPFGSPEEVTYANQLWQALAEARMVGPNAIGTTTYEGGTGLHTERLITVQGMVTVNGAEGFAIVKKNFIAGDQAATEEQVLEDPLKYLMVITVMYQRESGYDPDNKDWFWAAFRPDGSVNVNPMGMTMAGRIVGGGMMPDAPFNCIACHQAAPGDDYVFLHDSVPAR